MVSEASLPPPWEVRRIAYRVAPMLELPADPKRHTKPGRWP